MSGCETRLFVYGSLAPGESNEHMLSGLTGSWQTGTVRGKLIPSGWGNALGFPGINLQPDGPVVKGQLFSCEDLPDYWPVLDAFEGKEYQRIETSVTLKDGQPTNAYVYELLPEPKQM